MREFWKKISETGIIPGMDMQLSKRVRITNQLSASLSVIAFCYIFIFYFAGFHKEGLGVILIVGGILAPLRFNKQHQYTLARLWFIFALNLAVITYSYLFGRDAGIQFVFFPCACLPWLFFELKERSGITAGMLIPLIALLVFYSGSGVARVDITAEVQIVIRYTFLVVIFVILALCMLFFASQSFRAEQSLTNANEALQVSKEELESQQEELRQINEELTHQAEELRASEEELRTQEEELRQINSELEEKSETIELARATLADKAAELEVSGKYKSEFLANMSHELRTPLNSILILANLLKQNKFENLNEKQIEFASIIYKSGSDLLALINDILDLSKIEAGKVDFVFEETSVKDIARDMEQLFTALAADKKIDFSISVAADVPASFVTDRQRAEQVVKNLMSNAFKFTSENGRVSLGFALQQEKLAISVRDSGIGIAADKLEHIFEAFRQADGSTSRRFGGTGLGLSISRELMKRLRGTIAVQSAPGEGSTFTIFLPLNEVAGSTSSGETEITVADYRPEDVNEQTSVTDDRTGINPGQQSVLIIEDDLIFATHARDFAHQKGYKTIIAISGDEGLFYARKYKPSAIILDLGLPVIDGRNLLKILKSDDELKHIPVHIVSANDRADVPVGDIENFFTKPLHQKDLERAFSDIAFYIAEKYRSILIVAPGDIAISSMFGTLTAEKKNEIVYDVVSNMEEARRELKDRKADCIIADIGDSVDAGIATLKELRMLAGEEAYIITCLDSNLSGNEEKLLKTYSDSVIRKSTHYTGRLLDEIALFLHKLKKPQKRLTQERENDKTVDDSLKGKKVLLADDDMRNIFSLTALLEEHGMEVIAAEDGREAIDMLEGNAGIDIILMDIMMPEMDGYEAMRQIRAKGRYGNMPIIALTAKAMSGDREKCLQAGASDYITKPIDAGKLFSLMRVWMAQQ